MAFINPVAMAFIAKHYPEQVVGRICGMAQGIGMFAGTAGVTLGATALHVTGHYQMSITIVVVVGVFGCLCALGMNKPKTAERRIGAGVKA